MFGKLACVNAGSPADSASGGDALGVYGAAECVDQAAGLDAMLAACSTHNSKYHSNTLACNSVGSNAYLIGGTSAAECANISAALQVVVNEVTQFPGEDYALSCDSNHGIVIQTGTAYDAAAGCQEFTAGLNRFVKMNMNGIYYGCEVTSPSTTQTSTATSTATSSLTSTATTSATVTPSTSLTSTVTSTITTNNELSNVVMYFVGDAASVDGVKFKAGLVESAIKNGIPRDAITLTRIHVGSIIADMTVSGVEFGRMLDEAIVAGTLSVIVDGVAYIAYSTYSKIDPYRSSPPCDGHSIGNITYPVEGLAEAELHPGYQARSNPEQFLPSEIYRFEQELIETVQSSLEGGEHWGMDICVVSTIWYQKEPATLETSIYVRNTTADYVGIDNSTLQAVSDAVAAAYKAGEFNEAGLRGGTVEASAMELDLVDDSFFTPEAAEKSYTSALLGAVGGVLAISVLMLAFIYRAKQITEADHRKRVSMAISNSGVWRDDFDGSVTKTQLSNWSDHFQNAARSRPGSPYMDMAGRKSAEYGMPTGSPGTGSIGPYLQMGSPTSTNGALPPPTFNSNRPQYKAGGSDGQPDGASVGYFAVGDINSPRSPPGPAADAPSSHFYPSLSGSSAFFASGDGNGAVTSSPAANYGRSDRSDVPRSTRARQRGTGAADNRWQMAAGAVVNRPTLFADDADGGLDEFANAVDALLANKEHAAGYTDPAAKRSKMPRPALDADGADGADGAASAGDVDADGDDWENDALADGNWGDNVLPEPEGDFPTLRSATIKSSRPRPSLEPGYAMPTEADVGVIEPMEVHFAQQRDTVKTPDALVQMLQRPSLDGDESGSADATRDTLSKRMSPTRNHGGDGGSNIRPTLPTITEQNGTADEFVERDNALIPTQSFIQGMANIEKMPITELMSISDTIAEEPGAGPGGGAAWD